MNMKLVFGALMCAALAACVYDPLAYDPLVLPSPIVAPRYPSLFPLVYPPAYNQPRAPSVTCTTLPQPFPNSPFSTSTVTCH